MLVKHPQGPAASFKAPGLELERRLLYEVLRERRVTVRERVAGMERNVREVERLREATGAAWDPRGVGVELAVTVSDLMIASLNGVVEAREEAPCVLAEAVFDPAWVDLLEHARQEAGEPSIADLQRECRAAAAAEGRTLRLLVAPPPDPTPDPVGVAVKDAGGDEALEHDATPKPKPRKPMLRSVASRLRRGIHAVSKKRWKVPHAAKKEVALATPIESKAAIAASYSFCEVAGRKRGLQSLRRSSSMLTSFALPRETLGQAEAVAIPDAAESESEFEVDMAEVVLLFRLECARNAASSASENTGPTRKRVAGPLGRQPAEIPAQDPCCEYDQLRFYFNTKLGSFLAGGRRSSFSRRFRRRQVPHAQGSGPLSSSIASVLTSAMEEAPRGSFSRQADASACSELTILEEEEEEGEEEGEEEEAAVEGSSAMATEEFAAGACKKEESAGSGEKELERAPANVCAGMPTLAGIMSF